MRFSALIMIGLTFASLEAQEKNTKSGKKKKTPPFSWVSPIPGKLPPGVKHGIFTSPSMGIEVGYYI